MKRYANWSLIFMGAVAAVVALTSGVWIPVIQPNLVDEVRQTDFACADYINAIQCSILSQMYEDDPDKTLLLMEAMNPENNFEVIDPELTEVARDFQSFIGSSDPPSLSPIKGGVFNPPIDAIHNADGQARVMLIISQDRQALLYLVRLDKTDGNFSVTNAPDLRIYLSQHPEPDTPQEVFIGDEGAYEVGILKGNSGRQNYNLDSTVDINKYQSLVLYSPTLDQIFGVVPFPQVAPEGS